MDEIAQRWRSDNAKIGMRSTPECHNLNTLLAPDMGSSAVVVILYSTNTRMRKVTEDTHTHFDMYNRFVHMYSI